MSIQFWPTCGRVTVQYVENPNPFLKAGVLLRKAKHQKFSAVSARAFSALASTASSLFFSLVSKMSALVFGTSAFMK